MNKKRHILFLSSWYPSEVLPTNGDFVQRHAESVALKHYVTIIHIVSDKKQTSKVRITEAIINNVTTIVVYVNLRYKYLKFFYFFKLYLNEIKKIKNIDIIHLNISFPVGLVALYLKFFRNKLYIISEHWTKYIYPNNKSIGFLEKMVTKIIVKKAAYVCPVSKNLQFEMERFDLKGNYNPVPNVVDALLFTISEKKYSKFTITHISHMGNEHKNIVGILHVIEKLHYKIPDLKFQLIGDNSKQYLPIIKQLKIENTVVIDQISHVEVSKYMKESNVFILFSNYENLPCVILESFACGVPVVSTNVGGIKEYFPNDFGYLINPKDEISLEKSIMKIYTNELNFNKKIMHAYAEDNFGMLKICDLFSKLYNKTLQN